MTESNPLLYVTRYMTVRDMIILGNTCKYTQQDEDLWSFFYYEYKIREDEYSQIHLDNLKGIFYNDTKRAIKAHHMRKVLYWMSFSEQIEYLKSRRNILIYLIALWQRHGKKPIQDIMNGLNRGRAFQAGDSIRWRVSCWTMLRGKSNTFFRRNYLPVY